MIQNPPQTPPQTANVDDQGSKKDSASDTSTSNIATMKPYHPQRPRKTKFRPDATLIHFETLFGNESWPRYLIFKSETELTAAKLENILLTKCPTKEMSFRSTGNKEWLVETTTKIQSETYQSLENIDGIKVSVKRHDTLNSIEGTVILPPKNDGDGLPEETLLLKSLKLRYSNIENIKVYEIPSKRQNGSKLRIARIKFEGNILPTNIKIEGQKRELIPYVPKPLQCRNCSKYGHTHNKCRNPSKCAFCGSEDHKTTWNCGTPKCLNCGQNHHARSKICPFYIFNTELKLLVSRSGMSIQEAKLELKSKGFLDPARNPTYKEAAKRKPPSEPKGVEDKNPAQSLETPNDIIKIGKDEVVVHVPVRDSYEVLTQDDELPP